MATTIPYIVATEHWYSEALDKWLVAVCWSGMLCGSYDSEAEVLAALPYSERSTKMGD